MKIIRQIYLPPYNKKDLFIIILTILILIILPLVAFIGSQTNNFLGQAAGQTTFEAESGTKSGSISEITNAQASGGTYVVLGNASTGSAAVPIPQTGAYWGFTHAAAMADPYPLSSCVSGTNHAKLECKVQWAATQQGLSAPLQSDGKYHTAFEHIFTNCSDSDSKFQSGGSVWNSANVPGRKFLLVNMKCGTSWSTLANGGGASSIDVSMNRKIQLLSQLGVPVILTWHHEPENDSCGQTTPYGTPDDYRKAYRQFADNVRANGAGKVATGWIMMGYTFDLDSNSLFTSCTGLTANSGPMRNPENWWPGDDAVDWILADPYAQSGKTFSALVNPFVNWSNAACPTSGHPTTDWNCTPDRANKPLGLAEYSTTGEETIAYRESWIDDHKVKMQNYPDIKLYAWWSDQVSTANTPWWADYPATDTNRTVLKSFTRLSLDSWINNPTF